MPLIDFYFFFFLSLCPFRAHTRGGKREREGGGDQTVLAMTNTYT